MTGNYIGNNPNGLDIVLSDDYETNNSHLIASTKCVYDAIKDKNLATSSTPGIVKPGTGLQISEEGALNVVAEQTGCLPLTGGTMTGNLSFNIPGTEDHIGNIVAINREDSKCLVIDTYEEDDAGAFIILRKSSDTVNPGGFEINVRNADSSVSKYVQARLDGTFLWDGSEVFLPAGTVFAFAGNIDVPGCLICNGAAVSRSTYWRLFNAIGTTYGAGDGSTTFNLPNIEGRFIQGSTTAGTYVNAGLPNLVGSIFDDGWEGTVAAGLMQSIQDNAGRLGHSNRFSNRFGFDFNASRFNSIYGNSNTVQPPALTMRYYIKY